MLLNLPESRPTLASLNKSKVIDGPNETVEPSLSKHKHNYEWMIGTD